MREEESSSGNDCTEGEDVGRRKGDEDERVGLKKQAVTIKGGGQNGFSCLECHVKKPSKASGAMTVLVAKNRSRSYLVFLTRKQGRSGGDLARLECEAIIDKTTLCTKGLKRRKRDLILVDGV